MGLGTGLLLKRLNTLKHKRTWQSTIPETSAKVFGASALFELLKIWQFTALWECSIQKLWWHLEEEFTESTASLPAITHPSKLDEKVINR